MATSTSASGVASSSARPMRTASSPSTVRPDSIRSLATSTNRSYGFVHRLLSESGASLRSRGGANRNAKKA